MHTHPGQPPAGPSGRGSRCGATARAALPAAQTKQSALAVSAAQFQMPRPRAARSWGRGRGAPPRGQGPPTPLPRPRTRAGALNYLGSKWRKQGGWEGGERDRDRDSEAEDTGRD